MIRSRVTRLPVRIPARRPLSRRDAFQPLDAPNTLASNCVEGGDKAMSSLLKAKRLHGFGGSDHTSGFIQMSSTRVPGSLLLFCRTRTRISFPF